MASFIEKMKSCVLKALANRWLSSIVLILALDVTTFFAFARTSGSAGLPHQDKVLHAFGFAILTILGHCALNFDFFRSLNRFSLRLTSLNMAIWALYGIFIELGQKTLGYRQASVGDFLADAVGILIGTLLIWGWQLFPQERGRENG